MSKVGIMDLRPAIALAIVAGALSAADVAMDGAGEKKKSKPAIRKDLEARAKKLIADKPNGEAAKMAQAILKGSQLGPGEGWFQAPAQAKYNWKWLTKQCGVGEMEKITRKKFAGPATIFAVLDRNADNEIAADDFDWSERSSFVRQQAAASAVFRMVDRDGDGRLSSEEWAKFYERASKGKSLSQLSLRESLFPAPPLERRGEEPPGPTAEVLLRGLFAGEIGSMHEGPNAGDTAPDFTLTTRDGKTKFSLSAQRGKKPVVLVFGNFSCGPFRSWAGALDELHKKYSAQAEFVGVYVREAHPTDGWRMEQNDRVGIAFAQPKDDAGRAEVAGRCEATLKFPFPLLVDGVDDRVGHAYSGMPDRYYVIDRAGSVVYKSARGPFGFKAGEMEQSLLLTLLAEQKPSRPLASDASKKPVAGNGVRP